MKFIQKLLNRNKIVWYSYIQSADKFISLRRYNLSEINNTIDMLNDSSDEICIQLPTDYKHKIQISIWGESSTHCSIEHVKPEECSSYWLTTHKDKIKFLLNEIQVFADSPKEYGLILKEWD